jgi:recombinational DNA repair ATPase RecF
MLDIIDVDLEAPNFKMALSMEFSSLNLFTGANGSGKSFIIKFAWYTSYMLQLYKVQLNINPKTSEDFFAEHASKLFGYVFDNSEEISGWIQIRDKERRKLAFALELKNGELNSFDVDIIDPKEFLLSNIQSVKYASKETRTFEAYDRYKKIKKKFGLKSIATEEALDEICEFYKIYDVLWFESLPAKLIDFQAALKKDNIRTNFLDLINNSNADNNLEGVTTLGLENDEPVFIFEDGSTEAIKKFSSGVQSMTMLLLGGM